MTVDRLSDFVALLLSFARQAHHRLIESKIKFNNKVQSPEINDNVEPEPEATLVVPVVRLA